MVEVIILDFDGVLVQSTGIKTDAFQAVFSRWPDHVEAAMAFHSEHPTASRVVKFDHFVEEILDRPGDETLKQDLADRFSARCIDGVSEAPEVPGASAFLERFHGEIPMYISSVTPQDELDTILERRGAAPYIEAAYGDPPVSKPEAIDRILAEEGATADDAVFVGDSPSDQAAAQKRDVPFIGRDNGRAFQGDVPVHADMHEIAHAIDNRI